MVQLFRIQIRQKSFGTDRIRIYKTDIQKPKPKKYITNIFSSCRKLVLHLLNVVYSMFFLLNFKERKTNCSYYMLN